MSEAKKSPRPIEDRLVAKLARYLFDAGLDPLTTPLAGMLRPDLLGMPAGKTWSFYVEGKQYEKRDVAYLTRGYWQMLDTMHSLVGSAALREAFYVVFRLGGPMVHLPPEMRLADVDVYSVVIDISDPKTAGSRQRTKPIVITPEDVIEARPQDVVAPRKRSAIRRKAPATSPAPVTRKAAKTKTRTTTATAETPAKRGSSPRPSR